MEEGHNRFVGKKNPVLLGVIGCLSLVFIFVVLSLIAAITSGQGGLSPEEIAARKAGKTTLVDRDTKYKVFEIDSCEKVSGKVHMTGHTDLPDGARLIVGVAVKTKRDTDRSYGKDGETHVKDGKWVADLEIPTDPEFKREPHVADATWTPINEDEAITAQTGDKGQKLGGKHIRKPSPDINMFAVQKEVRLNLGKPEPVQIPNPSTYGANTPERAVAEVIQDWKNQDWDAMAKAVHLTKDPTEANKLEKCKTQFDGWDLRGAKLGPIEFPGDVHFGLKGNMAIVTVHVKSTSEGNLTNEDYDFVVLRLGEDNRPAATGRWGVNIEAVHPH